MIFHAGFLCTCFASSRKPDAQIVNGRIDVPAILFNRRVHCIHIFLFKMNDITID